MYMSVVLTIDLPDCIGEPHVIEEEKSGPFTCPICYDEAEEGETIAVATLSTCGHTFCMVCWKRYIGIRVTQEGEAVPGMLCCPGEGCKVPLQEETVRALASTHVLPRYGVNGCHMIHT